MLKRGKNITVGSFAAALVFASLFAAKYTEHINWISLLSALVPVLFLVLVNKRVAVGPIFCICLVWDMLNLFHMITAYHPYFFRIVIFQNIVFIFLIFSSNLRIPSRYYEDYLHIAAPLFFVCAVFIIISDAPFQFVLLGLAPAVFAKSRHKIPSAFLLGAISLSIGERGTFVTFVSFAFFYFILDKKAADKFWAYALYMATAVMCCLFPYFYVCLSHSNIGRFLNSLSVSMFQENFFSGRNVIWEILLDRVKGIDQIWGLGGNFVGQRVSAEFDMSTHNVFVFLVGQGGWILVILFLALFFHLFRRYCRRLEDAYMKVSAAFLLSLLIKMDLDLFMVANRFIDSMFIWVYLCASLAYGNSQIRVKE